MPSRFALGRFARASLVLVALLGCGGETPQPTPPPGPPTSAPSPPPPASAAPSAAASAAPQASGQPETKQAGSGRPPVLKMDPSEIADTFGSTPAARLELGS